MHLYSYEVTTSTTGVGSPKRNLFKELSIAGLAATFLGLGSLYLLLWTGVFV